LTLTNPLPVCLAVWFFLSLHDRGVARGGGLQGAYLVHGEQKQDGRLLERGGFHGNGGGGGEGRRRLGQHRGYTRPSSRATPLGGRSLSRQDTFDSETQGSRDSAYTEAGDSCVDAETDPYEEPQPFHRGGNGRFHSRPASWEDPGAEPNQENLDLEQHGRSNQRERYCQEPADYNKSQEDWGRGVFIH
ncbi:voltage-dependent L-type calcium channel subunit beta-1-like, partial [Conger conger]|uniref:voltage-dependent L-type calcium channel subunit beta-1-like n=1 Tax=Conger conger TaxID=82655 RepID=UPI002A5AA9D5